MNTNNVNISQYSTNFSRARSNLILVIVFTLINLVLSVMELNYYLLFSATVPQIAVWWGPVFAAELHIEAFKMIGLVIAFVVLGLYFICWALSKKVRSFILVATILFVIDTIVLLWVAFVGEFDTTFLIDIAFHCLILFFLISGTVAWVKLRGVDLNSFNSQQPIANYQYGGFPQPLNPENNPNPMQNQIPNQPQNPMQNQVSNQAFDQTQPQNQNNDNNDNLN